MWRRSDAYADDFVGVAERFRHVPYYWGGKSVQGLDCSGLVQLALEACGIACPRDSDMQEQGLGTALQINDLDGLRRGDLVFWNGHVGIMTDSSTLLHANGHHMMVVAEPLREAVDRIAGQLWPDHQPEAALRSVAPRHVDQIVQRLAG